MRKGLDFRALFFGVVTEQYALESVIEKKLNISGTLISVVGAFSPRLCLRSIALCPYRFDCRLRIIHNSYLKRVGGSSIDEAIMMTDEERVRILSEAKPNSWVALSCDESSVVGRGDSYEEAVDDAQKHGENDPLLIKIPDTWEPRVFLLCA